MVKKMMVIGAALLAIQAVTFAQPMMGGRGGIAGARGFQSSGEFARTELAAVRAELGDRPFGELTLNELEPYWARMETAIDKDRYIGLATAMSLRMPGLGQFRNGDTAAGAGFLTLHLGTVAGALVGSYFLLPAELRLDSFDYVGSTKEEIRTAWHAHTVQEYLPAMGVMAAGGLVDLGLRLWSAGTARAGARTAVEEGRARLTPVFGPGFLGMGMRF